MVWTLEAFDLIWVFESGSQSWLFFFEFCESFNKILLKFEFMGICQKKKKKISRLRRWGDFGTLSAKFYRILALTMPN